MRGQRSAFLIGLSVFLSLVLPSLGRATSRYMQLVAPGEGWALGKDGLFWTQDDGSHWKNISPPGVRYMNDVFFLDTSHGWALFSSNGKTENTLTFHVATTADGGATWTSSVVQSRDQEPDEFDGTAWLDFVDPKHGWLVLRRKTSIAFSMGWLLATDDGGKTWKQLSDPPIAGRPSFAIDSTGWLTGGAGGEEFYVTHDAGKSWRGDDLTPPKSAAGLDRPNYGRPEFQDAKNGYLSVFYSSTIHDQGSQSSILVLFTTTNSGQSWIPDRVLPNIHDSGAILPTAVAVSDSVLIVAPFSDTKRITLQTVGKDGGVSTSLTPAATDDANVREISFTSPQRGWIFTHGGRLLSTVDGGLTWAWLVPGEARRDLPPPLPEPGLQPFKKIDGVSTPASPGRPPH